MKVAIFFFVGFCLVLDTANADGSLKDPRIVGGTEALEGQFPYQACLRTRLTKQYLCGASIISNRFLLTAAHCVEGLYSHPSLVLAVVGALHRHHDGTTMKVDQIKKHDEWNFRTLLNDIALVRTVDEIVFSKTIQPIALPKHDLPKDGVARVVLSGWGRISFPDLDPVEPLQYAEFHTISFKNCFERYEKNEYNEYLKETMLCAIEKKGIGTCHGDSGSPLVDITSSNDKAIVGIVSWAVPCATGLSDVYTGVYPYIDWVKENTAT